MTMTRFIQIQNKIIRIDSIAYVDFLESGRAMIFMQGLTQEKQNIPLDTDDALTDQATIGFDLGLAWSAKKAEAAALSLKVGP